MVDVPLPALSAPGRLPQAAGGRLINCYPEKLPATAGKPFAYWRTPGLRPWGTSPGTNWRGALLVGSLIYAVINNTVYSYPATGGPGTALTGTVLGTRPVTMARNNKTPSPDVVIVSPDDGAFYINPATPTAVVSYPDLDVGIPNAVVFHRSFFIFTYGNGQTRSSDPNSTNINALNFANAESKPDTLYRPVPLGNGQLLLCGSTTLEVWGGTVNDTGYPFNYISTIARGIVGPYAIAGHDDGFGKGIFLVGDDFRVSRLDAYTPTPVSTNELDLLIEAEPDKTVISLSVYVSQGHGVVVVQGPAWCWEYDTTLLTWHERKSHLVDYWRGYLPLAAFGMWICGDKKSGNLAVIDGLKNTEFGSNDVQTVTITGTPTGGTFTLTSDGQTTAAIAFNATAAQVQTALQALTRIGANNIDVTGGPLPGVAVAIRFKDALAAKPIALMTATGALTGGTAPAVGVAHTVTGTLGDPMLIVIETGPMGAFPAPIRINAIELYLTKGVGRATGTDPLETDPDISIAISRDGGQNWSNPRVVKIGRQSLTDGRVRSAIWGQAQNQGVRWRLRESAPLSFAFMGIDMQVDPLR
ncbi:hypothetical protein ABID65_006708 [Bradyrhizobium sp. S3.9.2]|uniref:hypothetical protein n=1 Tax=Bradyrhizobium sp. S3.9.2 TaxID=3156432 RepID=UPI003395EEA0